MVDVCKRNCSECISVGNETVLRFVLITQLHVVIYSTRFDRFNKHGNGFGFVPVVLKNIQNGC